MVLGTVTLCYDAAMDQTIFITWAAFRFIHKDVLSIFQ